MPQGNFGPATDFAAQIAELRRNIQNLSTSPLLLNASTGTGIGQPGIFIDQSGVHAFNSSGQNIVGMLTSDGSVTAYDTSGNPVVRLGPLTQSNPGHYGLEILYNGAWTQVGAGAVDWSNITNKPATYAPSAHGSTHGSGGSDPVSLAGSQITSAVGQANGSQYAFSNAVAGTSFYAVWVGNAAGYTFGTNTSSIRGKANVTRHRINPERVLALKPVVYERRANHGYREYGLIAEQVLDAGVPELVQWMNGEVHGLRYDLLAVALLDVVKHQEERIAALECGEEPPPKPGWHEPAHEANNPPVVRAQPHPYTIKGD